MKRLNLILAISVVMSMYLMSCDEESDVKPVDKEVLDSPNSDVRLYPVRVVNYGSEDDSTVIQYKYNESFLLEEELVGKHYKSIYKYTGEGQLARITNFDDGSCTDYSTYEYNSEGQRVRENVFAPNDKLMSYYIFEYSNEGLLSAKSQYSANDLRILKFEYQHDEYGNVVQQKYMWADDKGELNTEKFDITSYEFDDKSNIYHWMYSNIGKVSNYNNIVKETRISYLGDEQYKNVTSYSFKYNDNGYPFSYSDEGDFHLKTRIEYQVVTNTP